MNPPVYILTFVCLLLMIYDFMYRRIPNVVTIPLILMGLYFGFPGTPVLWLASILVVTAWRYGWMGGGDAKLWLGLLWYMSYFFGEKVVFIMFIVQGITGILQIMMRTLAKKQLVGIQTAGSWRAFAYMTFLSFYSSGMLSGIHF